jgi:hypothetical protein
MRVSTTRSRRQSSAWHDSEKSLCCLKQAASSWADASDRLLPLPLHPSAPCQQRRRATYAGAYLAVHGVQATVAREQRAFLTVMVRGQRHHHQSHNADGGRQSHIEQMRLLVRRDVRGEAMTAVCSRLTPSVGLGGARAVRWDW